MRTQRYQCRECGGQSLWERKYRNVNTGALEDMGYGQSLWCQDCGEDRDSRTVCFVENEMDCTEHKRPFEVCMGTWED
jgi:hypothetical protein